MIVIKEHLVIVNNKKEKTMTSYYDDNFGEWHDTDDEDVRRFYHDTQRKSVRKKCKGCGKIVKIKPEYGYCNSCADKIERGFDL